MPVGSQPLLPTAAAAPCLAPAAAPRQVSAVAVAPDGLIASASLDKTIRLWRDGKCVQVRQASSGGRAGRLPCHAGRASGWGAA